MGLPPPHPGTETDPVSETLCSLEYWTKDTVQKPQSQNLPLVARSHMSYTQTSVNV
jgi:hypothetical protein